MPDLILTIIIAILCFSYFLERILEYLNSKSWNKDIPEEVKGIYDPEKYVKAKEYSKANTKFSLMSDTFSFALIIVMLLGSGFAFVDEKVRSYTEDPVWMTVLFFGILMLASDIINTPFTLYHTFVIEEKFGFNKTTAKTFITDKIKQYLIGGIIGGAMLAFFAFLYLSMGNNFWIYMWAVIGIFMILLTMFYSSWILPLFNKLTPLEAGELRNAIETYARQVDFKLNNIFVMDGSKRSTKANAFFSGLGSRKKIVLFNTLVNKHTTPELVAILAHEVGHYKKKHTRASVFLSLFQTGFMLYLLSWLISNPYLSEALGAEKGSFHMSLLAFGMLYSPVSMIIAIFMNMVSRKNEYEADRYATETYDGNALQGALKKLSVDHLSNLTPHKAYVFLNYSHPTLLHRVKAINAVMKSAKKSN